MAFILPVLRVTCNAGVRSHIHFCWDLNLAGVTRRGIFEQPRWSASIACITCAGPSFCPQPLQNGKNPEMRCRYASVESAVESLSLSLMGFLTGEHWAAHIGLPQKSSNPKYGPKSKVQSSKITGLGLSLSLSLSLSLPLSLSVSLSLSLQPLTPLFPHPSPASLPASRKAEPIMWLRLEQPEAAPSSANTVSTRTERTRERETSKYRQCEVAVCSPRWVAVLGCLSPFVHLHLSH